MSENFLCHDRAHIATSITRRAAFQRHLAVSIRDTDCSPLLRASQHRKSARLQAKNIAVREAFHGGLQSAMVVITQRDKTKGLQHAVGSFARCFENLSHTLDRA